MSSTVGSYPLPVWPAEGTVCKYDLFGDSRPIGKIYLTPRNDGGVSCIQSSTRAGSFGPNYSTALLCSTRLCSGNRLICFKGCCWSGTVLLDPIQYENMQRRKECCWIARHQPEIPNYCTGRTMDKWFNLVPIRKLSINPRIVSLWDCKRPTSYYHKSTPQQCSFVLRIHISI